MDEYESLAANFSASKLSIEKKLENFPAFAHRRDMAMLLNRYEIFKNILNVHGSIIECGINLGAGLFSWLHFSSILEPYNVSRFIYGFDTFNGYTKNDLDRDPKILGIAHESYNGITKQQVLDRCIANGVENEIELFEGDVESVIPQVLAEHKGKKFHASKAKFALVYIDCNGYIAALKSMETFLPYMVPGSIFAIDEKIQGGETEAMIDFAQSNNLTIEKPGINQVPTIIQVPN